jgi:uncharacterized protein (TIGR04255 family)
MADPTRPLAGPPPKEVPLPHMPLVTVVAQVRFALHLPIRDPIRVAVFQEAICDEFPHLEQQDVPTLNVLPGQIPQLSNETIKHWRFSDITHNWRITLTSEFITLETRNYETRQDFLERFERILQALEDTLRPKLVTRFGMRYINQIRGKQAQEVGKLFQPIPGTFSLAGASSRHILRLIQTCWFR